MEIDYQSICLRIKEARELTKEKQKIFANKIGIEQASLSSIENGKTPSLDTVIKVALVYQVNLNWLLTGEGEMLKSAAQSTQQHAENNIVVEIDKMKMEIGYLKKIIILSDEHNKQLQINVATLLKQIELLEEKLVRKI